MTQKEANQLNAAKAAVTASWEATCRASGIDPTSKFVVFDQASPEAVEHNRLMKEYLALRNRIAHNVARRERHAAYKSLGMNRVKGALGGVYYE